MRFLSELMWYRKIEYEISSLVNRYTRVLFITIKSWFGVFALHHRHRGLLQGHVRASIDIPLKRLTGLPTDPTAYQSIVLRSFVCTSIASIHTTSTFITGQLLDSTLLLTSLSVHVQQLYQLTGAPAKTLLLHEPSATPTPRTPQLLRSPTRQLRHPSCSLEMDSVQQTSSPYTSSFLLTPVSRASA